MAYRVSADIEYADGALAGLPIPAGYSLSCPSAFEANETRRWLAWVHRSGTFIRAAGTGNRYRVTGNVTTTAEG